MRQWPEEEGVTANSIAARLVPFKLIHRHRDISAIRKMRWRADLGKDSERTSLPSSCDGATSVQAYRELDSE